MGVFFDIFYKIYPKYKEGNHFRECSYEFKDVFPRYGYNDHQFT